jgi:predicted secreted hydrolase
MGASSVGDPSLGRRSIVRTGVLVGAALSLVLAGAPSRARARFPEAPPPEPLTRWDGTLVPTYDVLKSEWWYTIGFLTGQNQRGEARHLAFMVSVVRGASAYVVPLPLVVPTADIEVSLLDLDAKTHVTSVLASTMPDAKTFSVRGDGDPAHFAVRGEAGPGGGLAAHFVVAGDGFSMDLAEAPAKPQAAFGNDGIVHNGSLGDAVYVSRTRQVVGAPSTVILGDETMAVTGVAWEDHQVTGVNPFGSPVRWDWFAILLQDGTEVMAYQIFDAKTDVVLKNYAAHVQVDGTVDNLDGQLAMTELAATDYKGIRVPTGWNVGVPGVFEATLHHVVPLPDIATKFGQIEGAYFEGPCDVTDDGGALLAAWGEYFDGRLYHGPFAIGRLP